MLNSSIGFSSKTAQIYAAANTAIDKPNTMNTKYSKVLVDVGAKYLSDLNDNLNKNSNLDETNKRIC